LALWRKAKERGVKLGIGDPEATRYFMTVRTAALFLVNWSLPGFVCLPDNLCAARMGDIANAVGGPDVVGTGPRPGDERHQWLLSPGTVVSSSPGRIVLNDLEGKPHLGLSSEQAPQWDVAELLREAGVPLYGTAGGA
jgi:FlaA1/EpsC-like NDP-sugar epimerase